MKKIFLFSLISVLCCAILFSCERPQPEENEGNENVDPGTGDQGGDQGNSPDLFTKDFPYVAEFPVECGNLIAEGSDVGVTIEVTQVEDRNFIFELRPGAMVQSYKLDVYPVSQLYNMLLNDRNSGALTTSESWAVNERIRQYLFNESGSGGYAFSVDAFDNPEDFLQVEYDWMNTPYAPASAVAIPDCGYVIAVVGSTDIDISSSNQEELTLCYVHTTSQPLIGDPQCEIEVNAGYRKFSVRHYPNADADAIYFFGWYTSEIDEFIDSFGETLFRDFMRTRVSRPSYPDDPNNTDPDNPESMYYSVDFGENADHTLQSTTCAVAVDANLTPQADFSRVDFNLKEIPEDQPIVTPSVSVVEDRIGAVYFEFYAEMPKDCNTIFYNIYTEGEYHAWELRSSLERKKEAIRLVREGFGCHNPNFVWDADKEEAVGSQGRVLLRYHGKPMEEGEIVYIGFTGRNAMGTAGPLTFSEPIKLDSRNVTSPDQCKANESLKMTLSNPKRTSFRMDVTYDPSTVSMVYLQYMTPTNNPGLTPDDPWTEWIDFIFNDGLWGNEQNNYTPIVMEWPVLESGADYFVFTGMEPGEEYTVYLCAEDFDGNVSNVLFDTIRTEEIQVGPDPTINMALVPADSYPNDWKVTYTIDHDVEAILYCCTDHVSDLSTYIPGLTQSKLNDIKNSGIDYETWKNGIYDWVMDLGLSTESDTSQDWKGDQVVIAACIAIGKDEAGMPVYNFFHLICEDGKAQTLEEIFEKTE